jgi:phosphoribosylanthranilate isomerase
MRMRVKICGITRTADALAAIAAGADALGFMFYPPSPRHLEFDAARAIMAALPPLVTRVGVFVNPTESFVRQAIAAGVDTLQFHGEETPEFCGCFGLKTIKAFRVRNADSLAECPRHPKSAWLLDSFVPGQPGGTGACFNWELAKTAAQVHTVILAGGLTPQNVAEAVRQVRPYAVDVSSGVEATPGQKDLAKIRAFIDAAKGV